jgi:hypothetical protein
MANKLWERQKNGYLKYLEAKDEQLSLFADSRLLEMTHSHQLIENCNGCIHQDKDHERYCNNGMMCVEGEYYEIL